MKHSHASVRINYSQDFGAKKRESNVISIITSELLLSSDFTNNQLVLKYYDYHQIHRELSFDACISRNCLCNGCTHIYSVFYAHIYEFSLVGQKFVCGRQMSGVRIDL